MKFINFGKNNIVKNITSLTFNHGIQVLTQLLFIPLYLTYWDLNTYSEWILISTIPALLSISEFGLTTYGSNLIIILTKEKKINKANFALQNIIFFCTLILITVSCIFFTLDYFYNFQNKFSITSIDESDFIVVLIFIFLKYLFFSNSSFLRDLLKINHKFHKAVYIKSFFNITEIILIWSVLMFGGQILEITLISFLNYFIAIIIIYILIKKEFSWLRIINLNNIDKSFIKKIFYPSISFMTVNISKGLVAQCTILLLNFFSNDVFIILYNTLRLIINGGRHFVNILATSYHPEITINFAKKKLNKISHQFRSLFKYNLYLSTVIFFIMILFLEDLFIVWTKNEISWDFNFFIVFLIASYIEWLSIPLSTIPFAINKAETLNKVFVILLVTYIFILYALLTIKLSLAVPIALFVANLYGIIHIWLIFKKRNYLGKIS